MSATRRAAFAGRQALVEAVALNGFSDVAATPPFTSPHSQRVSPSRSEAETWCAGHCVHVALDLENLAQAFTGEDLGGLPACDGPAVGEHHGAWARPYEVAPADGEIGVGATHVAGVVAEREAGSVPHDDADGDRLRWGA
ncbi:hypothetical protein ABZ707_21810 [Streptomyces sp. NPDC006923]|uniref:hypothetical protein n=1 Tax=Streptomyces sp. NPDC006923 TaxID=3155355 RepID=UPI0033CC8545